jgi:hypothetical protein
MPMRRSLEEQSELADDLVSASPSLPKAPVMAEEPLSVVARATGELLKLPSGIGADELRQVEALVAMCALLVELDESREGVELVVKTEQGALCAFCLDARHVLIERLLPSLTHERLRERARRHAASLGAQP